LKQALLSARTGKSTRIVLIPTLFGAQSNEFRSKSGSLKDIRLKQALRSARTGKSTRIVLKSDQAH
jgi:hypothetical protein